MSARTLILAVAALFLAACASPAPGGGRASPMGLELALAEVAPGTVLATTTAVGPVAPLAWAADEDDDGTFIGGVLWYLPNRILDLFDIVRARLRVGPGLSLGARATEFADVFLGGYTSLYVGLPGPRGQRTPRWPVGFETKAGAEASIFDVTAEGETFTDAPLYGTYEFGVSTQLLLVGVAVGVEPFELIDFLAGLLTIDLADDDF